MYYHRIVDHPARNKKPPGGYRHFAFAQARKKSTFLGWNNKKTRPQLLRFSEDGIAIAVHHAETHVLFQIPKHLRKDAIIHVTRIRKDGTLGMSKPCAHCQAILQQEGVLFKNIWYTDSQGAWKCLGKT